MKRTATLWLLVMTAASLYGCRKMLDIQPKDHLLEETVYEDRNAVYSVLNGIYNSMAEKNCYGQSLTMTLPDLLAQYYNAYPQSYNVIVAGSYAGTDAHSLTDPVWSACYNLILQTNILMGHVSRDKDNGLDETDRNILLGETHAIRAFLHFDLLRLFGPIYVLDSNAQAIPYNMGEIQAIHKILPAAEVIRSICTDLDSAVRFLANDPVITDGITNTFSIVTGENFLQRRNFRLNYFAVKALQARVAIYSGNKPAAYACAEEVITKTKTIFAWSPPEASLPGSVNQDLTFSPEIIFGLFNTNLYQSYLSLFAPANSVVLKPDENGLLAFYEKNINDFRYRGWWRTDPAGVQKTKTFYKYLQPATNAFNPDPLQLYLQPLIRISEIYYIAAEAAPDQITAIAYLNTVRTHRGLTPLGPDADLEKGIAAEYRKELWGEGQLFYYYKRKNASSIPTAAGAATNAVFTPERYIIPLPLSETLNR